MEKSMLLCRVLMIIIAAGSLASCNMDVELEGLGPTGAQNGEWQGRCETDLVKAEVVLSITNQTITGITITRHENGRGKKAERVITSVLQKQHTAVDTVSGATFSSKVILKAVENALKAATTE